MKKTTLIFAVLALTATGAFAFKANENSNIAANLLSNNTEAQLRLEKDLASEIAVLSQQFNTQLEKDIASNFGN